jgi:BlaI family penicillinase repressor
MKKVPRISEAEWEVMKVVWERNEVRAGEVVKALETRHPKTVKTLLGRLVSKKALGFVKEGRAYVYRALVQEADCREAESESFLERVFGGGLRPMLLHFVDRKKLSAKEIQELKRILDGK